MAICLDESAHKDIATPVFSLSVFPFLVFSLQHIVTTMIAHSSAPSPSSRRQVLAGRGRRASTVSPTEKDILSIIEQPCPDPMPKNPPHQGTRPLPPVLELEPEHPPESPHQPDARVDQSSDKVSYLSQRFKSYFRPTQAAQQQQGDRDSDHAGPASPRPPTSTTQSSSRHRTSAASPPRTPTRAHDRSHVRSSLCYTFNALD